jgi:hypothetical protein
VSIGLLVSSFNVDDSLLFSESSEPSIIFVDDPAAARRRIRSARS